MFFSVLQCSLAAVNTLVGEGYFQALEALGQFPRCFRYGKENFNMLTREVFSMHERMVRGGEGGEGR